MKTEEQYFTEGRTIQDYMDEMRQYKGESNRVYQNFQLPTDRFVEEFGQQDIHFLAITEDWCGDAMMINPIIRKVAEACGIEMRVTLRDTDTDLIDRHLTNGGRAIPIILILDNQGNLIGKWGPRAPEVQQIVNEFRMSLPPKEDPSFGERQKEMISTITKRYSEDPMLWSYVYESFKRTLLEILKQRA